MYKELKHEDLDDESKPLISKTIKEIPFPNYVYFMLCTELGERFSYYGLLTILALFLRNVQLYSEETATIIFHSFCMLSYTTPIIGSIYADSILGKYKTVIYFSIIHTIGSTLIGVSALPSLSTRLSNFLTLFSLLIVAIGVGGIKPTIASFGADQFELNQIKQLTRFFSIYYFFINVGALVTVLVTPLLRRDVHCFGEESCYSLAFGVPAFVMFVAVIIFLLGSTAYLVKETTDNVLINTFKCIMYSLGKRKSLDSNRKHFLDAASDSFDVEFIKDVKTILEKSKIFSPLIIFWALYTQTSSSFVFQASRMDGVVGNNLTITPDQIQTLDPFLIICLIPIFATTLYPMLSKFRILETHLKRIRFGCFLMIISFMIAGFLELAIEKNYPALPNKDETSFNFVNTLPCNITVEINPIFTTNSNIQLGQLESHKIILESYDNSLLSNIPTVDYDIIVHPGSCILQDQKEIEFLSHPGEVETIVVSENNKSLTMLPSRTADDLTKSLEGNAKLRIQCLSLDFSKYSIVLISSSGENITFAFSAADPEILTTEFIPDKYEVYLYPGRDGNGQFLGQVELRNGESSLLVVFPNIDNKITMKKYMLTLANNINILWMLPQAIILTIAEIFIVPESYQFAYEETPLSMKALVQSIWLLTTAGGNLVVIIITSISIFPNQAVGFFSYAGLMAFGTLLFIYFAKSYNISSKAKEIESSETVLILESVGKTR